LKQGELESALKCEHCGQNQPVFSLLKQKCGPLCFHEGNILNSKTSSRPILCHICGSVATDLREYCDHFDHHKLEWPISCFTCSKPCDTVEAFFGHGCSCSLNDLNQATQDSEAAPQKSPSPNQTPMVQINAGALLSCVKSDVLQEDTVTSSPVAKTASAPKSLGTITITIESVDSSDSSDDDDADADADADDEKTGSQKNPSLSYDPISEDELEDNTAFAGIQKITRPCLDTEEISNVSSTNAPIGQEAPVYDDITSDDDEVLQTVSNEALEADTSFEATSHEIAQDIPYPAQADDQQSIIDHTLDRTEVIRTKLHLNSFKKHMLSVHVNIPANERTQADQSLENLNEERGVITYRYVSIATLLTLTTEHRGR
jgi:hypothetical protein